jgi:hypothetical protein
MYSEDLDLSLRLRLAGWDIGIAPRARVAHDYEFEKGDYKWFFLERNRWWVLLGVFPTALLVLLAPALLALEAALVVIAARDGWLGAKLRAQRAIVRELPAILARRRTVQATRVVSAAAFARSLSASLDSPFLAAAHNARGVVWDQAAFFRVVVRLLAWVDG